MGWHLTGRYLPWPWQHLPAGHRTCRTRLGHSVDFPRPTHAPNCQAHCGLQLSCAALVQGPRPRVDPQTEASHRVFGERAHTGPIPSRSQQASFYALTDLVGPALPRRTSPSKKMPVPKPFPVLNRRIEEVSEGGMVVGRYRVDGAADAAALTAGATDSSTTLCDRGRERPAKWWSAEVRAGAHAPRQGRWAPHRHVASLPPHQASPSPSQWGPLSWGTCMERDRRPCMPCMYPLPPWHPGHRQAAPGAAQ